MQFEIDGSEKFSLTSKGLKEVRGQASWNILEDGV